MELFITIVFWLLGTVISGFFAINIALKSTDYEHTEAWEKHLKRVQNLKEPETVNDLLVIHTKEDKKISYKTFVTFILFFCLIMGLFYSVYDTSIDRIHEHELALSTKKITN